MKISILVVISIILISSNARMLLPSEIKALKDKYPDGLGSIGTGANI